MTHFSRVQAALAHRTSDRVPCFFRRHAPAGFELNDEQKAFIDEIVDVGDYINLRAMEPSARLKAAHPAANELGIGYVQKGLYSEICYHPLAGVETIAQLEQFPWPDCQRKEQVAGLRQQALDIRARGKAVPVMGSWGGSTGIFEMSWYMRGMERFLCDCLDDRDFAERLLDIQLELHKDRWRLILEEVGDLADIICTGDDLGTQRGPLISPKLYRELIKPRQRALIQHIKALTKAPIYYHSCGAIEAFIPDFIDIGVEILDPIQPNCLDMDNLKRRYGDALTFYGGIDDQQVLPYGTPEQVRAEVFTRFEQLGGQGGAILGPSHWMQPDVPWENIEAMYLAILQCAN